MSPPLGLQSRTSGNLALILTTLTIVACGDDSGGGGNGQGGATTATSTSDASATSATGMTSTTATTVSSSTGTGGGLPSNNGFPASWPNGTTCGGEDDIFVWEYAPDTFILRQSLCTSFEGPFIYLLFGDDKVLMQDTGDGGIAIRNKVNEIIAAYLQAQQKTSIELVVTHSHSHGDHVGGDGQFQNQPNTTVVGTSVAAVQSFFGISNWPSEISSFELGSRALSVVPIPGHHAAHVALYDPRHDLVLTGDTLYPGRLYIQNFGDYKASTARLVNFLADKPVAWVLGTHIEMTNTPGVDFNFGATQHPNEHALQLERSHLVELDSAVQAMGNTPVLQAHDDFIIYPL